jgi:hypothetical protein
VNHNALAVELGVLAGSIGVLAPVPQTSAWVIFAALALPVGSWTYDVIRHDARGEVRR